MDQVKSIWDSLGVKSNMAGLLASLVMVLLAKPVGDAGLSYEQILAAFTAVVTAITSVLGIVGRITASTKLVASKKVALAHNAALAAKVSPKVSTPG